MAALIGALRVSLSADTAKFEAGMKRAQRTAQTSTSGINKSLGLMKAGLVGLASGLSIGLITNAIKNALDYAGSLGEISQQLGVTTKDLQVFRYAAGQSGVSTAEIDKGLGKLTITLGQVAAGAKAPIAALQAIGITADELRGKDTGEAFRLIADGLQKVTDRSQRAAIEVALFGRTGAKLDTLLSGGSQRINELSAAAERLGIVLSDEQIQRADETADKLEALKTVLAARIAGVVADNADAILGLGSALSTLIGWLGTALRSYQAFVAAAERGAARLAQLSPNAQTRAGGRLNQAVADARLRDLGNQERGGSSAADRAARFRRALGIVSPSSASGSSISKFLGGGGGGRKRGGSDDAERKRLEALRKAHQLEEEMRRAQTDILQAQRQLAHGYVERNSISVQILDAERAAYVAELDFEVASKEKTKAQADALLALYDQKDSLERQAIIEDERAQAAEDSAHLNQLTLDLDRDKLESQLQLAETAKEERRLRLMILDHLYRTERARLQAVLDDEKSSALAKEEARRRLSALSETYGNDRAGVMAGTRSPLEEYAASLPLTAEKMNEALENVAVNGLKSLEDGIISVIDGTKSLGDAFRDMAAGIISELLRISIQKAIIGPLANALFPGQGFEAGGYAGFATGGFTGAGSIKRVAGFVHKREFVLNAAATRRLGVPNLNALNRGAPMSAVSNDNSFGGSRGDVHIHMSGPMSDRQARRTGLQAAAGYKSEVGRASRAGVA